MAFTTKEVEEVEVAPPLPIVIPEPSVPKQQPEKPATPVEPEPEREPTLVPN